MGAEHLVRTEYLLGRENMERLGRARVAVFGLGGVGGYALEALARSGVGTLDIVDNDTVAASNRNRQILATESSTGRYKVDVAYDRILDIDPGITVNRHRTFFLPETAEEFDFSVYDYVVDAVDNVTAKLEIVELAMRNHVPVISCMGTGNKLDPTAFEVADIFDTSVCPLARVMRRELKKRNIRELKVVYSREAPIRFGEKGGDAGIGSVAFVPPVAGLILAGEVVRDLTRSTDIWRNTR